VADGTTLTSNPYQPSPLPTYTISGPHPAPGPTPPVPPGTYAPSPLDYTAHLETGDRNIPQQIHDRNTDAGTPAQGNWQFIVPTWQRQAPKAGVDLRQYPTPMSAPRSVQAAVAAVTPGTEFGPRTQAGLRAKYPGIDLSKPLGFYGGTAGGYQPPAAPATAVAAAQPANIGLGLAALTSGSDLKPSLTDDLQKTFGGDGGQQQPSGQADLQGQMAAGMGNVRQQQIAAQAAPLAAALQQRAAQPLTWGTHPYGAGMAGPQLPMAGQQAPGTTLNSTGANLYG
jgi:hypothetical protein